MPDLVHQLRQVKHRAFLLYKPLRFPIAHVLEPAYRTAHRVKPYRFDPAAWPGTHVTHDEPLLAPTDQPVPRRIFCFWTGENPMTPNRTRSMDSLRRMNPDVDICLVTPENLDTFVLPEHPLHPAYEHLSMIHRADYLRCYAMNFHGGGYTDIKPALRPWRAAFDRMDDSAAWLAGYRVPVRLMTPNCPDPRMEKAMRKTSEVRLGQCAYLGRPQTPLSREWWRELNRRLDHYAPAMAEFPGNGRGDNKGYPVPFTSLLAQVVDPLQVKYREHLLYTSEIQPLLADYL